MAMTGGDTEMAHAKGEKTGQGYDTPREPLAGNPPSILILDDDPDILYAATTLLGRNGLCAVGVATMEEALLQMERLPIRVVILDLIMPGVSDIAAFNAIRERQPGMPIIISTGIGFHNIKTEMIRAPQVYVLEKPYSCSALCAAVAEVLFDAVDADREGG